MIREKSKAFTKRWAFFCAEKHEKDGALAYKGRIFQEEDFRFREFTRVRIRFCSIINTNLASGRISEGGELIGNGWDGCNFTGIDYRGVTMDMERYERCAMGNASFHQVRLLEVRVRDCSYAGTLWENAELLDCVFETCNFRKARFIGGMMERTLFLDCIFDDTVLEGTKRSDVTFRNCTFRGRKGEWTKDCTFQDCTFESD